jgi:hypothetical protein
MNVPLDAIRCYDEIAAVRQSEDGLGTLFNKRNESRRKKNCKAELKAADYY